MKKKTKARNETILMVAVVALVAIVALQTIQIFSMGKSSKTTYSSTGMAASPQGFSSTEEMMAAHHGTGA
ncbi:MAG: hypothetical protein AABX14_01765, partial [Candidatus Aenigmatarchaeota archaeon]